MEQNNINNFLNIVQDKTISGEIDWQSEIYTSDIIKYSAEFQNIKLLLFYKQDHPVSFFISKDSNIYRINNSYDEVMCLYYIIYDIFNQKLNCIIKNVLKEAFI